MAEEETIVTPGCGRSAQVQKRKRNAFGKMRRARFLVVLAGTCNVRMAAEAAGVAATTVYDARRRDAEFARHWQEALAEGYDRLEAALMARALGTDGAGGSKRGKKAEDPRESGGDPEAAFAEAEIDSDLALKLLDRHRAAREGRARPMRAGRHVATEEETNQALIQRLAVLRRQLERGT